jgi:hypothetical protein
MDPRTWDLIPNNMRGIRLWHRIQLQPTVVPNYIRLHIADIFVVPRDDGSESFMRSMTGQIFTIELTLHADNCIWAEYSYAESNERLGNSRLFYPVINDREWSPDIKRARDWFVNTAVRLMRKFLYDGLEEKQGIDTKTKIKELRTFARTMLDEGGFNNDSVKQKSILSNRADSSIEQ